MTLFFAGNWIRRKDAYTGFERHAEVSPEAKDFGNYYSGELQQGNCAMNVHAASRKNDGAMWTVRNHDFHTGNRIRGR
ncbi:hypothetical protein [Azorhizophilus paspali]|uniref:Uncharacterized protein n=1 Tax=Azorhizophilus paspali TaxID=69963 RepID=A0ABV6SGC0_AZOPA